MYYRCAIVCFLGAVLACGCGRRDKEISPLLSAIMNDSVSMAYDRPGDSVPDDGCVRLRTRTKLPLSKLFSDINPQHIEVLGVTESYLSIRLIKLGHKAWGLSR